MRSAVNVAVAMSCAMLFSSSAGAQPQPAPQQPTGEVPPDHPPLGPRDVMEQAREQREQSENEAREERTAPAQPGQALHQAVSGEALEVATAEPRDGLPAGTIQVTVVDLDGNPVRGADVKIGTMSQENARDTIERTTNAQGVAMFTDLETGNSQAYRVNVPYRGARFSSTPFQLPPNRGYDVRITRLPVTSNEDNILQFLNRTFVEIRDDRVKIVQQAQIVNLGREAFVLPEEGRLIPLPEGFISFQSQAVMTDQRFEPTDEGFLLRGSFVPGRVTLVWGFDLPVSGADMDVNLPVAFRTYHVRVEADAAPGLSFSVAGLPDPEQVEGNGHKILVTERVYEPDEAQPTAVSVRLRGIPGPGPVRWIALGAALVLVMVSLLFLGGQSTNILAADARKRRKRELLRDAMELEKEFADGEVGPSHRKREMNLIIAELSDLLRQDAAAKAERDRGRAKRAKDSEDDDTSEQPTPKQSRGSAASAVFKIGLLLSLALGIGSLVLVMDQPEAPGWLPGDVFMMFLFIALGFGAALVFNRWGLHVMTAASVTSIVFYGMIWMGAIIEGVYNFGILYAFIAACVALVATVAAHFVYRAKPDPAAKSRTAKT